MDLNEIRVIRTKPYKLKNLIYIFLKYIKNTPYTVMIYLRYNKQRIEDILF